MWVTKKTKKNRRRRRRREKIIPEVSHLAARFVIRLESCRVDNDTARRSRQLGIFLIYLAVAISFFLFFFFSCRWREYMTTQGIWKCENTTARQYENVGTWNGGNEKLVESRDTCFRPECINVRMVWTNKTNSKWMEQCGKNNTKIFGHLFM